MATAAEFVENFLAACEKLRSDYGVVEDQNTIQTALMDVLGTDDVTEIFKKHSDLSVDEIANLVRDFNFATIKPNILTTVDLPEILDIEGVDYLFREEIVKFKGERWQIHKNDADPFPHPVHAHSYVRGVKMDLRNGKLYKKHTVVGQMKEKDLVSLRDRVQNIELPALNLDA